MIELLDAFVWRLTWWLVRLLWLPLLVIGIAYYIALPAVAALFQVVLTPSGLVAAALVLLWLRRR